jgi:hypothetical protein
MGYHFLEIEYTWFQLDETPLFLHKLFAMSPKKSYICGSSFIENKTPIGSSLKEHLFVVL